MLTRPSGSHAAYFLATLCPVSWVPQESMKGVIPLDGNCSRSSNRILVTWQFLAVKNSKSLVEGLLCVPTRMVPLDPSWVTPCISRPRKGLWTSPATLGGCVRERLAPTRASTHSPTHAQLPVGNRGAGSSLGAWRFQRA